MELIIRHFDSCIFHSRPWSHRWCFHNNAWRKLYVLLTDTLELNSHFFQFIVNVFHESDVLCPLTGSFGQHTALTVTDTWCVWWFLKWFSWFIIRSYSKVWVSTWKPNSEFLDFPRARTWVAPLRPPRTSSNSYVLWPSNWTETLNW